MIRIKVFLSFISLFLSQYAFGQSPNFQYDTTYVKSTHELLALRLFFPQKYTRVVAKTPDSNEKITLVPNTGLKMGLGFNYQRLTINVSFPVGFLNPDRQNNWPGNLDLQSHIYAPK